MNLCFDSITIAGFKCFVGKPQKLALASSKPGLVFVRGWNETEPSLESNGAGKSTLFDALTWCLYGRTITNLRNPDIRPRYGKTATRVSIAVHTDDQQHTISRYTDPNKLLIDGKEVSQQEVDRLIRIGIDIFSHTVLLGQGRDLFFDLDPSKKMQLFSDTLALERWEERSFKAGESAIELARQMASLEGEQTSCDANIKQLDVLLKNTKERLDEWETDRKERIAGFSKQLEEWQLKLPKLQDQLATATLAYDGAATEAKALRQEITVLGEELLVAKSKENKAEAEINQHKLRRKELLKELEDLGNADVCPVCNQPIKKSSSLAQHKDELQNRIDALDKAIKAGVSTKLKDTISNVNAKLTSAIKHATHFQEKSDHARQEVEGLSPTVAEYETKIRNAQVNKDTWAQEHNPYRDQIAELRRTRTKFEDELDQITEELKLTTRKVTRTKLWIKGFKDVRLLLIEEILQELELATNAMLPESGLINWSVKYDIEKETKSGSIKRGINVTILSPKNDKPVRWETWSGGESQRLRLVGALALSQVLLSHAGVDTNLEILDEPAKFISVGGVRDLCEFLAERAEVLDKDIFLVDHQAVESSSMSNVIQVIKTKDGSCIK